MIYNRKTISILYVCLLSLLFVDQQVFASEQYFLDGQQILIYKAINWWYEAPKKDTEKMICGAVVRYRYQGSVRHSYDESSMVLTIRPEDGFADSLSVLSPDRNFRRSVTLQGNKGNILSESAGVPTLIIEEQPLNNKYTLLFNSITVTEYQKLIKDINSWQFVLYGKIWGLKSGKVALYRSPDNLRNCRKNKLTKNEQPPFTLRISRRTDNGVLAEFMLKKKQTSTGGQHGHEDRP